MSLTIGFVSALLIGLSCTWLRMDRDRAPHGIFDLLHPYLYENAGVPAWWPAFCSAYDLVAAAYLAWLIAARKVPVRERAP